jgi:hypothetical protein
VEVSKRSELDDRLEWSPEKRRPYGAVWNVFGMPTVSALLDYVTFSRSGTFGLSGLHLIRCRLLSTIEECLSLFLLKIRPPI